MTIKIFQCNMLGENCYIISDSTDSTNECVIIDCGAIYESEFSAISEYISANNLRPVHLLCTHGHLDHNFGNEFIFKTYGLRPEIHSADVPLLMDIKNQSAHFFGIPLQCEAVKPEHTLTHDETIRFGQTELQVIHTPGHSQGGVVFYCEKEKVAFTGDTLFNMSIGRTDLEGGSFSQLEASLRLLCQRLDDDTTIYCGHGPKSIMKSEKQYNPYIK